MPRIRTIKPEFWSDEKLSELVAIDRLVFLGLIGMADDYGRLHDNIKVIDAFVFPNSSETVRESVANLSRISRIRRGNCSNGAKVIEIINWSKHQRVDKPQNHLALPPIVKTIEGTPGNIAIPESFANRSGIIPEKVATLPGTVGTREADQGTMDQGEGARTRSPEFSKVWLQWKKHLSEQFKPLSPTTEEVQLMDLSRRWPDEADQILVVAFSIRKQAKNLIINGDHATENEPSKIGKQKPTAEQRLDKILKEQLG